MKIVRIEYDPGTMSAPAFTDIYTEDGQRMAYQGKQANRMHKKYKVGDEFIETAS